MRFLTLSEVLYLQRKLLASTGGAAGVRDLKIIEAAIAAPKATFGGDDLYPGVLPKAATLCYSLVQGHGFIDGNKRVGHAAMEVFLALNGYTLEATVDGQENIIVMVASGKLSREQLLEWLERHARAHETLP